MNSISYKTYPLGDQALTVEFGDEISPALNDRAVALGKYFEQNPFPGLIETLPAYCTLTIFYNVGEVRQAFPEAQPAYETVKTLAIEALRKIDPTTNTPRKIVRIPVDFSYECALDLESLARRNDLTVDDSIEIFTERRYRVYMLGFLPGFAYMGEVDERLAAPRKTTPRLKVPKGSVGIAGRQTGIYPFESPGGWQIIGRTDFELFSTRSEQPCVLEASDLVEFYAVRK